MEHCHVYLAGSMSGISLEDQMKWRNQIKDAILYGGYDYDIKPHFFLPPLYYGFEEKRHNTEKEVMDFDLNRLRKSDLVIVNFNNPNSLGTAMELAIAFENKIPVIGLNENNAELHPWLIECTTRMCNNMEELVEHVVQFYLS